MKILVVDDEPIIADTLVDILTGEGHEALAVSDGKAAIRWAELVRPDAVVTDVIMPGMDGIETAKAIMKLVPGCRIILFSGQAASADLLAKARADGYLFEILAKPINPEVLVPKLGAPQRGPRDLPRGRATLRLFVQFDPMLLKPLSTHRNAQWRMVVSQ